MLLRKTALVAALCNSAATAQNLPPGNAGTIVASRGGRNGH